MRKELIQIVSALFVMIFIGYAYDKNNMLKDKFQLLDLLRGLNRIDEEHKQILFDVFHQLTEFLKRYL